MPVGTVVSAQAAALAVGIVGSVAGMAWWQAALTAVAVAALCLCPMRGRTLLDWGWTAVRYRTGPGADTSAFTDVDAADGATVGLCRAAGMVAAVIEVQPEPGAVTRLTRDTADHDQLLPLHMLAKSLTQHDISLSGIDVIAHGRRSDTTAPTAACYDDLLGPLPAVAQRTVWVVVRFDASTESAAVARRGGGNVGVGRVVSIAAQRIVRALDVAGVRGRILTAPEIATARSMIAGEPDGQRRSWRYAAVPSGCSTGHAIAPREVNAALLSTIWATAALSTTVTIRLRPGRARNEFRFAASCRSTTGAAPAGGCRPELTPTVGRDVEALRSHLPGAPDALDALTPFATVDLAFLDAVPVAAGGCGQLIGSDADGRGVTVRVVGPDIDVVTVAGDPYLARQVVLRAVATGARIVVHTEQPQLWRQLVGAVADPDRLLLAGPDTPVPPWATAVVLDGVGPDPLPRGVTAIRVHPDPVPVGGTPVSLVRVGGHDNRVILWANGTRYDLTLVTIPAETALLGSPRPAGDPLPAR
ncbi:type VII secretion protein EccE [Rhodococcus sp. NPDC054953]